MFEVERMEINVSQMLIIPKEEPLEHGQGRRVYLKEEPSLRKRWLNPKKNEFYLDCHEIQKMRHFSYIHQ